MGAVRDRLGEKEDKFAYNLLTACAMRMSGVFAIATSTIALHMGLLFRLAGADRVPGRPALVVRGWARANR